MPITLTVGTNTYVSLADADTYHETYANLDWAGFTDDEQRKQALVLATQSVDLLYGSKYKSFVYDDAQALLFPRVTFTDNDTRTVSGIPTCLKNAVAEIALLYLNGTNIFPQANTAQNIKNEVIQVGGITLNNQNYRSNESESFEGFRKVDILLRPILKQTATNWSIKA